MHTTVFEHDNLVRRLRAAGCVFAEDEADLLIAEAESSIDLVSMTEQRVAGQPLEHILGWVDFCGQRIIVERGVFVPRQRTALLAELAADLGQSTDADEVPRVVVDLCCGAGAIAAVLAARLPLIELYAADVDPVAVACARRNLEPIGGQVFAGDLFAALPTSLCGRIDILTANTPYVPQDQLAMMPPEARLHEAVVALDGGVDGLDVQRALCRGVAQWMAPGGHLLVETSMAQASVAAELFTAAGLTCHVHHDDERGGTVVVGRMPSA